MIKKINRFERKWIYRNNDHLTLINSLIRSNLFFKTHFPLRKVNSIYFDDKNFSSILEDKEGELNPYYQRFKSHEYDFNINNNDVFATCIH